MFVKRSSNDLIDMRKYETNLSSLFRNELNKTLKDPEVCRF